jgi:hypothetical protein
MGEITMFRDVDDDSRAAIAGLGATLREQGPQVWEVPDSALDDAVDLLAARGHSFRARYSTEGFAQRAAPGVAHVGLISEETIDDLPPGPKLFAADDGSLMATDDLVDRLSTVLSGVRWEPREEGGSYALSQARILPDPVVIRTLFRKWSRPGGRWVVSHDGREFMTSRNIDVITDSGVAWATEYLHDGEVYPRPRIAVFSRPVIDALVSWGVPFSNDPYYYLRVEE